MYKEHPAFEKPQNLNIKIWRYMDFTKFVSLLDRKTLFFPRADKLPDPFEGSYSKPITEAFHALELDGLKNLPSITYNRLRKCMTINSWHMSEHESAAMWKLYLKSDEGVAIQSTFKSLTKSFDAHTEDDVFIGIVKYIDYETEWFPADNLFYSFLHKRQSFEHERELRAIVARFSNMNVPEEELSIGAYIRVDLGELVEKVFVSPTSPKWFNELTKSIANKYELEKEVMQSSLARGPVY